MLSNLTTALRSGAIALLLTSNALVAKADDLTGIVDRYMVWRGATPYEQLQSIHEKGTLQTAGLKGTEEIWADNSGHVRESDNLGVLKQTKVVAPKSSWDTAPSGQLETLSIGDRLSIGRLQALQFPDALRGRGGTKTKLSGFATRNGRTWAVVRVSFGDEDTYDAFIDPDTGALCGFRINEDRQKRFEGFDDWRFVDGVRMPFVYTTETDAPDDDSTVKITQIELNHTLAPNLFLRPAPIRKAFFKNGASSSGWIDFDLFAGTRIYFPVKVNGHDVIALLDSGATVSSIDKAFAATIGLTPKGGFVGAGSGGVVTFGFIGGVKIQVGNVTLHDVNLGAFDFAPVARSIGHPLPFVLGDEIFNELAVEIDFQHRRIDFVDPATVVKPYGAIAVPLIRVKDRTVPVSIEGAAPVPFEFDLGDGSPLDVYPAYYNIHKLLDGRRTSQLIRGGVGGFQPEMVATLRHVTFAGVHFTQVPTNFTADILSVDNSNLIFGTIGLPILARFRLIVDYAHDRLFATPSADAGGTPFAKDRLGLHLVKKGSDLIVKFISPGSPSQAAGFKIGDRIALIDHAPVDDWPAAALRGLSHRAAGAVVTFTLVDGRAKRVELADFY